MVFNEKAGLVLLSKVKSITIHYFDEVQKYYKAFGYCLFQTFDFSIPIYIYSLKGCVNPFNQFIYIAAVNFKVEKILHNIVFVLDLT